MLRVGLTGGIASGKSHVLRRLAAHGLQTMDLDAVAREVTAPGSRALAEIVREFGPAVVDAEGRLDRAALASRVFARAEERERLNAIVHPRVRAEEARRAAALAESREAVLVTDAALLVEAGVHLRFDRLVVVHCDPRLQLARLRARDGLDEAQARARVEAQMSGDVKKSFAHFVVDSSGTPDETSRAADRLAGELAELAGRPPASARASRRALLGALVHGPRGGPRGLSPAVVLRSLRERGGLEMGALASQLSPPAAAPWYRAAASARPGAPAALLGTAVVAAALGRGAPDPPYLAGAAASLARLTHEQPEQRAEACLFALVLQELTVSDEPLAALHTTVSQHRRMAERWGGAPVSRDLDAVWSAVTQHPADPPAAAEACRALGGEGDLAGALAGVAAGPGSDAPAFLSDALDRLDLRP